MPSPSSSSDRTVVGLGSSPSLPAYGSSPATYYSPGSDRGHGIDLGSSSKPRLQASSNAAGKQPARPANDKPASAAEPARASYFTNELDPRDDNFRSRYIAVFNACDYDESSPLAIVTALMKFEHEAFGHAVPLERAQNVYIRFDSFSNAIRAQQALVRHGLLSAFVTQREFAMARSQDPNSVNAFEGQVCIQILAENMTLSTTDPYVSAVKGIAANILSRFGNILEMHHSRTFPTGDFEFRVEFDSVMASQLAAANKEGCGFSGRNKQPSFSWSAQGCCLWVVRNNTFKEYPTMASLPMQIPRSFHQAQDRHQQVRLENINNGTDVRSTIMLRNIPNKLDYLSLKALLDQYCFGMYDFLYLRIDFGTQANVGYAFINFVDVEGIVKLLDSIDGRLWFGFRSAKAAEVSYATIQGKESLVNKFRNSSVMQETANCRPRLYHTLRDARATNDEPTSVRLVGTEMRFPPPDNIAKLQRSVDSAATVGLFPPRGTAAGGLVIDRRLRGSGSSYDPGNPRENSELTTSPISVQELPQWLKRAVEHWFAWTHANSSYIPFDRIPAQVIVHEFFPAINFWMVRLVPAGPGVIARPQPAFELDATPRAHLGRNDGYNTYPSD